MRDEYESIYYKTMLRNYGVQVISAREPMPNEVGLAKLMETVIQGMDRFFLDNLGEQVGAGMRQLAAGGYWTGGIPPFGYLAEEIDNREGYVNSDGIVKRSILVPDAGEAAIVKRIFEISATTGQGGNAINNQLSKEIGMPVLGKRGRPLGGRGINEILRKSIYKGSVVYGEFKFNMVFADSAEVDAPRYRKKRVKGNPNECIRYQNERLRLVSDELWNAAQKSRVKNSLLDFGHGPKRAGYLLTGLCRCEKCGGLFAGHWQKSKNSTYYYYRCRNVMNGAGLCSNTLKLRGQSLERAVLAAVESVVQIDTDMDALVAATLAAIEKEYADVVDEAVLRDQQKQIVRKIQKLIELATQVPDSKEIAGQIREKEAERSLIETRLALTERRKEISPESIRKEVQARIGETLKLINDSSDQAVMRNELKKWIDAILIQPDGAVFILWKAGHRQKLEPLPDMFCGKKRKSGVVIEPKQKAS